MKAKSGKPKAESRDRTRKSERGSRIQSDTAKGRGGDTAKVQETLFAESFAPSPRPRAPASPSSDSRLSTFRRAAS